MHAHPVTRRVGRDLIEPALDRAHVALQIGQPRGARPRDETGADQRVELGPDIRLRFSDGGGCGTAQDRQHVGGSGHYFLDLTRDGAGGARHAVTHLRLQAVPARLVPRRAARRAHQLIDRGGVAISQECGHVRVRVGREDELGPGAEA